MTLASPQHTVSNTGMGRSCHLKPLRLESGVKEMSVHTDQEQVDTLYKKGKYIFMNYGIMHIYAACSVRKLVPIVILK